MNKPITIPKALASVIVNDFAKAIEAREAVEHRLSSIPPQEAVVQRWTEDIKSIASEQYAGFDLNSYPVQTRRQREFEKLARYRAEIPQRLSVYAKALEAIDRTKQLVISANTRFKYNSPSVPWPATPRILANDSWPSCWPIKREVAKSLKTEKIHNRVFDTDKALPLSRPPAQSSFRITIGAHQIELTARYQEGIAFFLDSLQSYLSGASSSRWPAITESVRCAIRWPQLDRYLDECPNPWLPLDFVDEEFGLRGSLTRRDELADLLAHISEESGRWYLEHPPGRINIEDIFLDHEDIEALMTIGLVKWGANKSITELLHYMPFAQVKAKFILTGLAAPKSFHIAEKRFNELIAVYSFEYLHEWIHEFINPSEFIEILEPIGWNREDRLGPRARANVLVSTLVKLDEECNGAIKILHWGN